MSDGLYSNNGLYIDIFPLDFLKSKDSISTTIKRGYINYLKHVLKISACPKLFLKKEGHVKYLFDRLFSCLFLRSFSVENLLVVSALFCVHTITIS